MAHRFYLPALNPQAEQVVLPPETAHQVRSVLRMRVGETIAGFCGDGFEYEIALARLERDNVTGRITGRHPGRPEPRVRITVYHGLLKRDKLEWAFEKGAEVGAATFVPVISARTVADQARDAKRERWRRIVIEAVEQCGRSHVPEVAAPLRFAEAVAQAGHYERALFAWEEADTGAGTAAHAISLRRAAWCDNAPPPQRVAVFIGPEGGFTNEEAALATRAGWQVVSLGGRILRAETAGVVAVANLLYEWEA